MHAEKRSCSRPSHSSRAVALPVAQLPAHQSVARTQFFAGQHYRRLTQRVLIRTTLFLRRTLRFPARYFVNRPLPISHSCSVFAALCAARSSTCYALSAGPVPVFRATSSRGVSMPLVVPVFAVSTISVHLAPLRCAVRATRMLGQATLHCASARQIRRALLQPVCSLELENRFKLKEEVSRVP